MKSLPARLRFSPVLFVALTVLLFSLACSSAGVNEDGYPVEEPDAALEYPDDDELADHACGNPDWSQAPPDVVSLEDLQ